MVEDRLDLSLMEQQISIGKFPKMTSVLVEKGGKLIYEKYFGDGNQQCLNDSRSVTKSVTGLTAGIAEQKLGIEIVTVKVRAALKALNKDAALNDPTAKDLLTMASPLAADDSDGESPGNEDRMHEKEKWLEWALEIPVKPGVARGPSGLYPFCYATVNAVLAGQVVQKLVGVPLDKDITSQLLRPLGITKSQFQYSKSDETMSGGGLRLTSRDLTKLGRLILNQGVYSGKQIVPSKWIREMITPHHVDTVMPGVDYGYLIWRVKLGNDEASKAWCMLGNGGNIIAAIPKKDLVLTITRTDYNSRSTPTETLELIGKIILPHVK